MYKHPTSGRNKIRAFITLLVLSPFYSFSQTLPAAEADNQCLIDNNGNVVYAAPSWQSGQQKMFILNSNCFPDVKLGVGVIPDAKLHIKLTQNSTTHPIIVEKPLSGNAGNYKLMQLDNTGLLYAREVKVNLESWPDYVFDRSYKLMSLQELKTYIQLNKHLPGVPEASVMEKDGVTLGKTSTMLMEKVEELTLHLIGVEERLNTQEQIVTQQRELMRLQNEELEELRSRIKGLKSAK